MFSLKSAEFLGTQHFRKSGCFFQVPIYVFYRIALIASDSCIILCSGNCVLSILKQRANLLSSNKLTFKLLCNIGQQNLCTNRPISTPIRIQAGRLSNEICCETCQFKWLSNAEISFHLQNELFASEFKIKIWKYCFQTFL